jgi:hypothetical protein
MLQHNRNLLKKEKAEKDHAEREHVGNYCLRNKEILLKKRGKETPKVRSCYNTCANCSGPKVSEIVRMLVQ